MGGGASVPPIRVVIVDDQEMFVDALRSMLELDAGIDVLATSTDPQSVADIAADADVVLIDLVLGATDGLELTRRVRAERPSQLVIVISGRSDNRAAADALEAGASAFLLKGGLGLDVAETIRTVHALRVASIDPDTAPPA